MDSARQGDKALADSDCPSAIRHFTQALMEHPRSPAYYIKRSTAYSRLKSADGGPDPTSALRDAELALFLACDRGKRELILSAQLRRGVALYHMERYGDAAFVFDIIKGKVGGANDKGRDDKVRDAIAAGNSMPTVHKNGFEQEIPIWMMKVQGKLSKLPEGDAKAVVSVIEYPTDTKVPTEKELKLQLEALKSGRIGTEEQQVKDDNKPKAPVETDLTAMNTSQNANKTDNISSTSPSVGPSPEKVRHEWYQSYDSAVVTLYAKGVPKDSLEADIQSDSATIQFPLPSGNLFDFTLDPLYAPIDPSSSKVSVMSTKVEIILRKQVPGQKWSALEASSTNPRPANTQMSTNSAPADPSGPAYPTSSRHGSKDWDKVASDLTKKSKPKSGSKKKDKQPKNDSEAGDESDSSASVDSDYASGDPVDGFFKKLYANADPDTRRAMMKSYVESQGTSLSTNWAEVGKGKVEPHQSKD
ncbi:hypothetical protein PHISCL_01575 [Aspergillus sclerotialis]|uniref:SGT1 and CS domain protein n=1 Tax=Aspergillus sclerotialis TaxID=2070753 RepID=A0A3A2ZTL0_9EURO|nr:hypothetical protein PHISCL_01575 [Aspergillus sclerotialis]